MTVRERIFAVRAGSYDAESRSFLAVAATETPVPMIDSAGPYGEILPMDTVRLPTGSLPFIDSHQRGSVRSQLGTAAEWSVEGSELVARVRLSTADDVLPIEQRIADGTLDAVSVGWVASGFQEFESSGARFKRATGWAPLELSLVQSAADRNARIRAAQRGSVMTTATGVPAPTPVTQAPAATPAPTATLDGERRAEVRQLARAVGIEGEQADQIIDRSATVEGAKAAILDLVTRRKTAPVVTMGESNDDPETIGAHLTAAMGARMQGKRPESKDPASRYFGNSWLDMVDAWASANGVSTRSMGRSDLAKLVFSGSRNPGHTTSDFPDLVGDAISKVAAQTFEERRSRLSQIARTILLPDFNETKAVGIGGAGLLKPLNEAGEIQAVSRPEAAQSIKLVTYAARIDLSRELIMNDRLGLLGDSSAEFAKMAVRRENAQLVSTLQSTANLDDGSPPFDASRGNITASADLVVAGLTTARQALRSRKGLDAESEIDIEPRWIIVAPDRESSGEMVITAIQAATTGRCQPVCRPPWLDRRQWFDGRFELVPRR